MIQRPNSDAASNGQSTPQNDDTHHIFVRDASVGAHREEPLTPFMVSPEYLSRKSERSAQPKRPLNPARTPEKVKMYSQIGALDAAYRIRRPRTTIPVMDMSSRRGQLLEKYHSSSAKVKGFSLAVFAAIAGAAKSAWGYVSNMAHGLFGVGTKVKYSAASGTAIKKFGMPRPLFRSGAALAVLLMVFGLGFLSGWFGGDQNSTGGGSGGANGSGGNAVIEVRQSSDNGSGQSSAPAPQTAAPPPGGEAAGGVQTASGELQGAGNTSSVPAPAPAVGGRGGGETTAPTTSSSGSGSGGTGSSDDGTNIATPLPSLPITQVITVPPATVTSNDGKPIVGTSGTSLIVN